MYTSTHTDTYSNTYARMTAVMDHFELFLTCAGLENKKIEKLMDAVRDKKLNSVGIYLEENGFRISEVSLYVDWEKHDYQVRQFGESFDFNIPGWKDGTAPEAYVAVQRLVKFSRVRSLPIRSWICVSKSVARNAEEHEKLCENLGYDFGSKVPDWKDDALCENTRNISGLEECCITTKQVPDNRYWQ